MSYLCKWYQWERRICWRSFKTTLGVQWKFSDELLVSFLWNKSVVCCALLTCTVAEDVLVSALRERKLAFHRLWRHMFKRNLLCKYTRHVWVFDGAVRALWWSLSAFASCIPTNVSARACLIWDGCRFEACDWLSRADCFACGPFSRPLVVSFSEPPAPPTQTSAPVLSHVETLQTHYRH